MGGVEKSGFSPSYKATVFITQIDLCTWLTVQKKIRGVLYNIIYVIVVTFFIIVILYTPNRIISKIKNNEIDWLRSMGRTYNCITRN